MTLVKINSYGGFIVSLSIYYKTLNSNTQTVINDLSINYISETSHQLIGKSSKIVW